jgi:predicted AAA+ superfamily ATPase
MESLKDAVILKDIGQRYKIKDLETFKKLFYFLMTNI